MLEFYTANTLYDRVSTLYKNSCCEITQLFETFGRGQSCLIEQKSLCGVRTHFYDKKGTNHRFCDRKVLDVLVECPLCFLLVLCNMNFRGNLAQKNQVWSL